MRADFTVTFRIVSGPTVGRTSQAITDSAGRASFSYVGANPGVDTLQATAVVSGETLSSNLAAVEWTSIPTTLVYTGAQVGEYSDPMLLAARLTESPTGQPLAGRTLAFVLGSQTATAVTGTDGTATVEIVPAGLPGATPLAVAFAGEGAWSGSATSRLAVITPEDTVLTLSGVSAVVGGGAQPVSARLVDDDGQPLAGRTVTFRLGTSTAEATTGADGTATASLSVPNLATGTARLEATFAGDAWYRPSSAAKTVLVAQPTGFVIWGGNTPGLRLGDRVQFWGAQWSRQVQGGDYAAQADFKGWSTAPLPPHLCQPNAHTTGTPRLDASCWTSKPGNSKPPAQLGSYIQVIVATSIAKSGSTIYGNIAATVVLQVDKSTAYGPDPGHPGYGTVIGVLEDGAGVFASSAVSSMSAQAATSTRRISLYSPEMSLMAETELTTTARPAILYEYIWFDGRPLAQVDGAGTVSWSFTDHLGTPLLQTSALQGIVWRAEHEPYGSIYALRSYDRHQPLRFPGQEADQLGTGANGVTERSYNVHRWYRAGWGRYTQADPIDLSDGPNLYTYVADRPVSFFDLNGLYLRNNTKCTLYVKESERGKTHAVLPGSEWPVEFDGFADPCKHPNEVFKIKDLTDIVVDENHIARPSVRTDMVTLRESIGYSFMQSEDSASFESMGGWHGLDFKRSLNSSHPPDKGWNELFDKSLPSNCACTCPDNGPATCSIP
jgi:RHS repeat-associated protein